MRGESTAEREEADTERRITEKDRHADKKQRTGKFLGLDLEWSFTDFTSPGVAQCTS